MLLFGCGYSNGRGNGALPDVGEMPPADLFVDMPPPADASMPADGSDLMSVGDMYVDPPLTQVECTVTLRRPVDPDGGYPEETVGTRMEVLTVNSEDIPNQQWDAHARFTAHPQSVADGRDGPNHTGLAVKDWPPLSQPVRSYALDLSNRYSLKRLGNRLILSSTPFLDIQNPAGKVILPATHVIKQNGVVVALDDVLVPDFLNEDVVQLNSAIECLVECLDPVTCHSFSSAACIGVVDAPFPGDIQVTCDATK